MTYVVTEACIRCKYTDCVSVCPVDCFHEGANFVVIDPQVCIDCAVCVPECPVGAIVAEDELTSDQQPYLALNARYAKQWPLITQAREPLPDAEQWARVASKLEQLQA
ncbi:ferredoxin FdxA [Piscinibacter sp. XHJ-5]|uniref:ferredoxin FdxA n=1 Tax=Piscinibacter sp. XHJ-5 TaxID=3037797 RepID=UPI0024530516|nr:ferredoxin FdxA [Piscinibacter sp. XHJ-5]